MTEVSDDDDLILRVEADPLIGRRLAQRYEVLSVIGRGGMGVVYKARHLNMDRLVALKTLDITRISNVESLKRFQTEAQALSRVKQGNIVRIYDFGVTPDGQPFMVMDYLEGVSLRKVLKQEGCLGLNRTVSIYRQVVDALMAAHQAGIVHKDLKPENIVLVPGDDLETEHAYVLDFGIADLAGQADRRESREVQTVVRQEVMGSPPYMSPEQCAMQPVVDGRSDIYSLGVCLFETLSGQFPFKARSAMEMLDCHLSAKPLVLKDMGTHVSAYESVTALIAKALEKRPEKRQQTSQEFKEELEEAYTRDLKRGLALKVRMDFEEPRTKEFVSRGSESSESAKRPKRSLKAEILGFFAGDSQPDKVEKSEPQYKFVFCPHCGEQTKPDVLFCLACSRSLASTEEYSRIRVAKGEFSLPKAQDMGGSQSLTFSKRSREFDRSRSNFRIMLLAGLAITLAVALFAISIFWK